MAFSNYFQTLFSDESKKCEQSEYELKDVSSEDFKALLGYAYTGKIEIRSNNVEVCGFRLYFRNS